MRSLYERLGKHDGIAKLVNDAVAAHLRNPLVKTRFENAKDLEALRKHATAFFCAGTGGPEAYSGQDMKAAHRGMNISEQEYMAVMDDILGALQKNGFDDEVRKDVVAILYSLKDDIIRV